jgi:hypothetical protein
MLIVLGLVIGLLFVAPALLLWTGRFIMTNTGPRSRSRLAGFSEPSEAFALSDGSIHCEGGADAMPWFRRPMLPAFGESETED